MASTTHLTYSGTLTLPLTISAIYAAFTDVSPPQPFLAFAAASVSSVGLFDSVLFVFTRKRLLLGRSAGHKSTGGRSSGQVHVSREEVRYPASVQPAPSSRLTEACCRRCSSRAPKPSSSTSSLNGRSSGPYRRATSPWARRLRTTSSPPTRAKRTSSRAVARVGSSGASEGPGRALSWLARRRPQAESSGACDRFETRFCLSTLAAD